MTRLSLAGLLVALASTSLAAGQSSTPPAPPPAAPTAPTAPTPSVYDALWTSDVNLPRTLSVYDDGFSPADATTSTIKELDEIDAPHDGRFLMSFTDPVFESIVGPLNALYAATGLRAGLAYTTIFQLGNAGANGFSGDLDLMTAWTLLGRGTANSGTLVFTGENRFRQADQPASAVGPEMGTLQPTTNGFNNRGWVVRDAYWLQRLFDNRLRLMIGRADLTDFVGAHRLQNLNSSFSNRWFSANPVVASPGHGPAAGISFAPCDWFYVSAGLANAYGTTTTISVDTLDQGDFFYTTEFGLTPNIDGLGAGRYQLMLWRMDERSERGLPSDQGISVILNQEIGDTLLVFARYGNSEASLTNIQNAVQAGAGLQNLFGAESLTGFAGSWGEPDRAGWRNETVFELFHRFQLSRFSQFTLGGQLIFDPSNSPTDSNVVGVLSLRYRVAF